MLEPLQSEIESYPLIFLKPILRSIIIHFRSQLTRNFSKVTFAMTHFFDAMTVYELLFGAITTTHEKEKKGVKRSKADCK